MERSIDNIEQSATESQWLLRFPTLWCSPRSPSLLHLVTLLLLLLPFHAFSRLSFDSIATRIWCGAIHPGHVALPAEQGSSLRRRPSCLRRQVRQQQRQHLRRRLCFGRDYRRHARLCIRTSGLHLFRLYMHRLKIDNWINDCYSQISKALTGTERKDLMRKLPKFIYDEEKALEVSPSLFYFSTQFSLILF